MLDLDSLEAKARAADQGVLLFDGAKLYADTTLSLIRELREARAAVAAEREACAQRLEDRAAHYTKDGTVGSTIASCAAIIRARGAKGGEKC